MDRSRRYVLRGARTPILHHQETALIWTGHDMNVLQARRQVEYLPGTAAQGTKTRLILAPQENTLGFPEKNSTLEDPPRVKALRYGIYLRFQLPQADGARISQGQDMFPRRTEAAPQNFPQMLQGVS